MQNDDQEDMVDLVHAAHSNLATFHSQCAQKLFKKPKRILVAMKGVVESFARAKLRTLAKRWAERLEEFSVVKKTSKKSDALAYAYFNYAGGTKKSPKEVSELTRAARRCGEAIRGMPGVLARILRGRRIPHQRKGSGQTSEDESLGLGRTSPGVSEAVPTKATVCPTTSPSNGKEAGDESLLYLQADGSSGKRLCAEYECCDQKRRLTLRV